MNILEELERILRIFNMRYDRADTFSHHVAFSEELKVIYERERDTWGAAIFEVERFYREFKESMRDV